MLYSLMRLLPGYIGNLKKKNKVSQIHLHLFIGSFHINSSRILTLCFNNFFLESTYISCEVVLGLEV